MSRVNPVTSRVDRPDAARPLLISRYYPWSERIWKVLFSYSVILAGHLKAGRWGREVSLIGLFFTVAILMVLRHTFHKHGGRLTFQVINALVVEILNALFTSLATWLTDRENHRSYSEHANHLLARAFKSMSTPFFRGEDGGLQVHQLLRVPVLHRLPKGQGKNGF